MDNWDEIRTAYQVARLGTVSGAAEVLGVHHATVIRHIDALEAALGAKLFQRHARGYTATEAGQDLLSVAGVANDQFTQLAGRIKGRGDEVTGDLIVTSLGSLSPLLVPTIAKFQERHPGPQGAPDLRRAAVPAGIRRGACGDPGRQAARSARQRGAALLHPDPAAGGECGLCGKARAAHRRDAGKSPLRGPNEETPRAPYYRWLTETVPEASIVFRASDMRAVKEAVIAGIGIGFVAGWDNSRTEDLVDMLPPLEEWTAKIWLVTHMDLHRTAKVQASCGT
jgi:DNA-binding transcriptional LysR family regulator